MRILMASDLFHPFLLGGGKSERYEIAIGKKCEVTCENSAGWEFRQHLVVLWLMEKFK